MGRMIIVSNRLPVKASKDANDQMIFTPSEGGLATGLGAIYKEGDNLWLGWPGLFTDVVEEKRQSEMDLRRRT